MFSLVYLLAAATAPLTPPDGTYTYSVMVSGTSTGKTSVTLSHAAQGIQLSETATASYNGADFAGKATLSLDGVLAPVGYSATYNPPGRILHANLSFNGQTIGETSENGSVTFSLLEGTKRFVVLDGTMFAGFFIFPSQLQAWSPQPVTLVAPMFGQSVSIAPDRALKPDRPARVPAGDTAISVSSPVEFTLWYDPSTLVVDEVDVPRQDAAYVRLRTP